VAIAGGACRLLHRQLVLQALKVMGEFVSQFTMSQRVRAPSNYAVDCLDIADGKDLWKKDLFSKDSKGASPINE
jgi:hypothetical protein